jgi:hypothetical protein
MDLVECLKSFLRHIDKMNEMTDLANKINNSKRQEAQQALEELFPYILDLGKFIHDQLVKGIDVETELAKLQEETKDMHGAEIWVFPWFNTYSGPSLHDKFSKS